MSKSCVDWSELDAEEAGDDNHPDTLMHLMEKSESNQVRIELQQLPAPQRTALSLFLIEELSYEEISQAMTLKLSTVKSHIHRGRLSLIADLSVVRRPQVSDKNWFDEKPTDKLSAQIHQAAEYELERRSPLSQTERRRFLDFIWLAPLAFAALAGVWLNRQHTEPETTDTSVADLDLLSIETTDISRLCISHPL